MISNLVRHRVDGIPDFQEYVITSCAPRMLLQMKSKLSEPFIQSLMEVDVSAFGFLSTYMKNKPKPDLALCSMISFINTVWPGTIPHLVKWCHATTTNRSYQLYVVIFLGHALYLLVGSGVIECHLQVITSQLFGKHSGKTKQEDIPHKDLQHIQPPTLWDDKPELLGNEGSEETDQGEECNLC